MEFKVDNIFVIIDKGTAFLGEFLNGDCIEGETVYAPTKKGLVKTRVLGVKKVDGLSAILTEVVRGACVGQITKV